MTRRRQPYVWGCYSNTEPPDDDDYPDDEGQDDFPEHDDDGPADDPVADEHAADAAADRYERDLDARASQ